MAKKKLPPDPKPTDTPAFSGRTHICFVLDKSGSMGSQRDSAISGFNEYVTQQQTLKDDTVLTLVLFDTVVTTPFVDVPLADVKEITKHDYVPGGCTALFDAVGRAIALTEPKVKAEDRVLVNILTDGLENASRQITSHDQLKSIIAMKEREGNWTFTYMGSGENWRDEAQAMGVALGNMTQLDASNVAASVLTASAATRSYRMTAMAAATNFYVGPNAPKCGPNVKPIVVPQTPIQVSRPLPQRLARNPFSASATTDDLKSLIERAKA